MADRWLFKRKKIISMTNYGKNKDDVVQNECSTCRSSFLNNSCIRRTMLKTAFSNISVGIVRNWCRMFSFIIPIDVGRSRYFNNLRTNNHTDSDLETLEAKHNAQSSSTDLSKMSFTCLEKWRGALLLHKSRAFHEGFISQARDVAM